MTATPEQQRAIYQKLVDELTEKRGRIDPKAAAKSPGVAAALAETDRLIEKYCRKLADLDGRGGGA